MGYGMRRQKDHGTKVSRDSWYWVCVERQLLLQHHGGAVLPAAVKTRTIQALVGIILIFVTMTLFLGVVAIAEKMSLTVVSVGLNFEPSLRAQGANLQQAVRTADGDHSDPSTEHRNLPSNPGSFPVQESDDQLIKEQEELTQKHDEHTILESYKAKSAATDQMNGASKGPNGEIGNHHRASQLQLSSSAPEQDQAENNFPELAENCSHEVFPVRETCAHIRASCTSTKAHKYEIASGNFKVVHNDKKVLYCYIRDDCRALHMDMLEELILSSACTCMKDWTVVPKLGVSRQEGPGPSNEAPSLITTVSGRAEETPSWVQFPYYSDGDETEQLMLEIRQNGTLPCHHVRTETAQVVALPGQQQGRSFRLYAGPIYELLVVSIGQDGWPRCAGGDYYETDLSGPRWKSRPPALDLKNGTYSIQLQMDPRFAGNYTFKIVLLFANFHALHHRPEKFARLEEIATFEIEFLKQPSTTPESLIATTGLSPGNSVTSAGAPPPLLALKLPMCRRGDFKKKYWSGRWTREKFNEDCEYDKFGRWQCVDGNLQCQKPWCEGPVGSLESNGWVYSAHCAFKIFQKEEAWKCLDGKWLFFWGDSNHIDTIRNLLNFVLGFDHRIKHLDRRMDVVYFSPPHNRSSVRITSMFNGHSNATKNYEGLFSLHDQKFADQLRSFFTGETAPDFMMMNSGLHDGFFWHEVDRFVKDGVEFAAEFWSDVWSSMRVRRPDILYRTTVATGGKSRSHAFNPHKMELFNHLMVDEFVKLNLERFQIIDGFDYTYPWHWDHKTNDGVHYGRPPSKTKWAGDNVGHRYFVDLMLVHMLLNAICTPPK